MLEERKPGTSSGTARGASTTMGREIHGAKRGEGEATDEPARGSTSFAELTLDEWLTKFGRIYGKRHDKHTTEYLISRLVEEVAELVNPMESQDRDKIAPNLADVFSWICSLAIKLNVNLSELAWQKYGKNAPRPAWSSSSSEGSQPSLADFSEPQTLHEWQEFISKVYQRENATLTPMTALVAMMKDVGDLAMLQRKRASPEQVTSKLAALLAWTLTASQLLKLDLAEVVFAKYDDHCPVCHQPICNTDTCHPFANLYVSFGNKTTDEEKYVILDAGAKHGFRVLVNTSPSVQATKDLATSLDLINKSDAACVVLSPPESAGESASYYRQIFETLSCYSILSRGNVWVFARDTTKDFAQYLLSAFQSEKIMLTSYSDANHLRALFDRSLDELQAKSAARGK